MEEKSGPRHRRIWVRPGGTVLKYEHLCRSSERRPRPTFRCLTYPLERR